MGITNSLISTTSIGTPANGFSLSNIASIAQQYIISPISAFGLAGFVFDAEAEAIADISTDITDNYAEDNKALQDHIAIRPKRVTLKGYVGELVFNTPGSGPSNLQKLAQDLTVVNAYLPALTIGAQTIVDGLNTQTLPPLTSLSNIYGTVKNILGAFGNTARQQNAYTFFKSLAQSGTLMSVQTPWEFMTNMAIEKVVAIQDDKSIYISDFAITLKEIRIAQASTTAFTPGGTGGVIPSTGLTQQGAAALQAQPVANQGVISGLQNPTNALPGAQALLQNGESFASNTAIAKLFNSGIPQ